MYRRREESETPKVLFWALVLLVVVTGILFGTSAIFQVYYNYKFNVGCSGRLKRAADSNTVEFAEKELAVAIQYLEKHGFTEGNTALLFPTPASDVGFWYSNLKEAHQELLSIPSEASKLERTNVLMKLRETLIDHNKDGDSITVPSGISIFPYNFQWFLFDGIISVLGIISLVGILVLSKLFTN